MSYRLSTASWIPYPTYLSRCEVFRMVPRLSIVVSLFPPVKSTEAMYGRSMPRLHRLQAEDVSSISVAKLPDEITSIIDDIRARVESRGVFGVKPNGHSALFLSYYLRDVPFQARVDQQSRRIRCQRGNVHANIESSVSSCRSWEDEQMTAREHPCSYIERVSLPKPPFLPTLTAFADLLREHPFPKRKGSAQSAPKAGTSEAKT